MKFIFLFALIIVFLWLAASLTGGVMACSGNSDGKKSFLVIYILERMLGLIVVSQLLFYLIRNY